MGTLLSRARLLAWSAASAAALCGATALAQSPPRAGWYFGLDLGASRTDLSGADIAGGFGSRGITGTGTLDRTEGGFGLKLGYKLSPRWSLEGGYADLGRFGFGVATTAPAAGALGGSYQARAWSFSGIGSVPLADRFSLYGKLGVARSHVERDVDTQTAGLGAAHADAKRNGWLLGAGGKYDFGAQWFARAGWDRYTRVGDERTGRGDIDFYSIGLGRRF